MKIYLAGPEVFLPDAIEVGKTKRSLCARAGFEGLYPLDNEIDNNKLKSLSESIFAGNVHMIESSDLIIANLTPFRGISADPGTVFEIGYGIALGKSIYGYSYDPRPIFERVQDATRQAHSLHQDDLRHYASDGYAVENFGLSENLMIAESIRVSGGVFLTGTSNGEPLRDTSLFEACLNEAAKRMLSHPKRARTAAA